MANTNSTTTYSSTSGLTTGLLVSYFTDTFVPTNQVLYEAAISMNAETTAPVINFPAQTDSIAIIPTSLKAFTPTGITFVSGTTPTVTAALKIGSVVVAAATALVSSGSVALTAGQVLSIPVAPTSSTGTMVGQNASVFDITLAFTGSPTSCTGAIKFLIEGVQVPL